MDAPLILFCRQREDALLYKNGNNNIGNTSTLVECSVVSRAWA